MNIGTILTIPAHTSLRQNYSSFVTSWASPQHAEIISFDPEARDCTLRILGKEGSFLADLDYLRGFEAEVPGRDRAPIECPCDETFTPLRDGTLLRIPAGYEGRIVGSENIVKFMVDTTCQIESCAEGFGEYAVIFDSPRESAVWVHHDDADLWVIR